MSELLFLADDLADGGKEEVFATDGTTAGTVALTGTTLSIPSGTGFPDATLVDGELYLQTASSGNANPELYGSNGSTVSLLDPATDAGSYIALGIAPISFIGPSGTPELGFFGQDPQDRYAIHLITSDGTASGTSIVNGSFVDYTPSFLPVESVAATTVYFTGPDNSGTPQLYAGNASSVVQLDPIVTDTTDGYSYDSTDPALLLDGGTANPLLTFFGFVPGQGLQFFVSTGTAQGTYGLGGYYFAQPSKLVEAGPDVFFSAVLNGVEQVFASNGGALNAVNPTGSSIPATTLTPIGVLTPTGGLPEAAFVAANSSGAYQLYTSTGSTAQAVTGAAIGGIPASMISGGSQVFFVSTDISGNPVLFASNGSTVTQLDPSGSGTNLVLSSTSVTPLAFTSASGASEVAFFARAIGNANGPYQLYISNGTAGGTQAISGASFAADPSATLQEAGNLVVFSANDGSQTELYAYNGSSVTKLVPGGSNDTLVPASSVAAFTGPDGRERVAFIANTSPGAGTPTYQLVVSDGTAAGTTVLGSATFSSPNATFAANGASLVFTETSSSGNTTLWSTDGATLTQLVPAGGSLTGAILPSGTSYSIAAASASAKDGTTGTTPYTFTVTRTGSDATAATVAWSATGSGTNPAPASLFPVTAGTVTFAPGQSAATLSINVNGAAIAKAEGFSVTIAGSADADGNVSSNDAQIATATASGTIGANGGGSTTTPPPTPPVFNLSATNSSQPDATSGTLPYTFTVTRSGDTSQTQALTYSLIGAGGAPIQSGLFQNPTGNVTFAPGATSAVITLNAIGQVLLSGTGFALALAPSTNTTASEIASNYAGGYIGANTAPASFGVYPYSAAQSDGLPGTTTPYVFNVYRFNDTSQTQTLSYSVSGTGSNPAPSSLFQNGTGTVTFAPGVTQVPVTLNVSGATVTSEEDFQLTIAAGSNVSASQIQASTASGAIYANSSAGSSSGSSGGTSGGTTTPAPLDPSAVSINAAAVFGFANVGSPVFNAQVNMDGNLALARGTGLTPGFIGGYLAGIEVRILANLETSGGSTATIIGDLRSNMDTLSPILSAAGTDVGYGFLSGLGTGGPTNKAIPAQLGADITTALAPDQAATQAVAGCIVGAVNFVQSYINNVGAGQPPLTALRATESVSL